MPNEQNLIPLNQRAKSVQREIQSKGGKAKAEKERTKKTMREYADFLLSLPVSDGRKWNKLSRMGIPPEGIDNKMAVIAALMLAAQAGDVSAAKELRNIIGEDSVQENDALEKLDAVLADLDEVMRRD